MPSVDPIASSATGYPADLDPFLVVIADVLINAAELPEFTAKNVTIVPPEKSAKEIDDTIQDHMAKMKGLSVLIIAGDGQNVEPELAEPRFKIGFEIQIFSHPASRAKNATKPLALVIATIRKLHGSSPAIAGFEWYERITATEFKSLPDADFTAYAIVFDRELQF